MMVKKKINNKKNNFLKKWKHKKIMKKSIYFVKIFRWVDHFCLRQFGGKASTEREKEIQKPVLYQSHQETLWDLSKCIDQCICVEHFHRKRMQNLFSSLLVLRCSSNLQQNLVRQMFL